MEKWSGSGPVQTESFPATGAFRVHWTSKTTGSGDPGLLKVTLHSAVSGRPLAGVVEHRGDGEETQYVTEDPREFFFVVDAERCSWTLEVEEGVAAILEQKRES